MKYTRLSVSRVDLMTNSAEEKKPTGIATVMASEGAPVQPQRRNPLWGIMGKIFRVESVGKQCQ